MIKLIKRTTDKKFLQSLSADTWVDTAKEAFEMTYFECEAAKTELLKIYQPQEIKEVVVFTKSKPMSEEETVELSGILGLKNMTSILKPSTIGKKNDYLKGLNLTESSLKNLSKK